MGNLIQLGIIEAPKTCGSCKYGEEGWGKYIECKYHNVLTDTGKTCDNYLTEG